MIPPTECRDDTGCAHRRGLTDACERDVVRERERATVIV